MGGPFPIYFKRFAANIRCSFSHVSARRPPYRTIAPRASPRTTAASRARNTTAPYRRRNHFSHWNAGSSFSPRIVQLLQGHAQPGQIDRFQQSKKHPQPDQQQHSGDQHGNHQHDEVGTSEPLLNGHRIPSPVSLFYHSIKEGRKIKPILNPPQKGPSAGPCSQSGPAKPRGANFRPVWFVCPHPRPFVKKTLTRGGR